jgi:D-alanyl-D-alanine dipeptidase
MRFVDVSKHGFVVEPRYYFFGWSTSPVILGRESAVKALVKARSYLPKGYNFKVWDFKRTRQVQLIIIDSFRKRLKLLHPKLSDKKIMNLVYTFAARPLKVVTNPGTHRNGGAVDLTIIDKNGDELYMGTDHDHLTVVSALDYYENILPLSSFEKEARKNRRLLKKVMLKVGFTPYAPEWWHWDYRSA